MSRHNAQQDSGRDPLLSDLGLSQAAGHLAAGLLMFAKEKAPFTKVSPGLLGAIYMFPSGRFQPFFLIDDSLVSCGNRKKQGFFKFRVLSPSPKSHQFYFSRENEHFLNT